MQLYDQALPSHLVSSVFGVKYVFLPTSSVLLALPAVSSTSVSVLTCQERLRRPAVSASDPAGSCRSDRQGYVQP